MLYYCTCIFNFFMYVYGQLSAIKDLLLLLLFIIICILSEENLLQIFLSFNLHDFLQMQTKIIHPPLLKIHCRKAELHTKLSLYNCNFKPTYLFSEPQQSLHYIHSDVSVLPLGLYQANP